MTMANDFSAVSIEAVRAGYAVTGPIIAFRAITFDIDPETGASIVQNIIELDPSNRTSRQLARDFVKTANGWIDERTKVHLPEGMTMPAQVTNPVTKLQKVIEFKIKEELTRS